MNAGDDLKSISQRKLQIVDEKIAAHQAEVAALQTTFETLCRKCRELDELRNSALPVSQLPLDVLTEICFLICETEDSSKWRIPGPLMIGRICRAWRRIAWSTPKLWTEISLSLSKTRYATQKDLLQAWLKRGAHCQLRIKLENHASIPDAAVSLEWQPPTDIFSILFETCDRWKELELESYANFFKVLEERPNARFTSLQSLSICRHQLQKYEDEPPDWVFKLHHPLHNLKLEYGFMKRNFDIDWSHLRVLTTNTSLEDCLDILKNCDMLTSCTLAVREGMYLPPGSPEIFLPDLAHASLSGDEDLIASLMHSLRTPALKKLQVKLEYTEGSNVLWISGLLEMAQQSLFRLRSLVIDQTEDETATEELVLDLLCKLPSIEELELRFYETFVLSNLTFDRLKLGHAGDRDQNGCLPNLTSFTYIGQISFDPKSLLAMLESRASSLQTSMPTNICNNLSPKFRMQINYANDDWYHDQSPNELHGFYKKVALLNSVEVDLNCSC